MSFVTLVDKIGAKDKKIRKGKGKKKKKKFQRSFVDLIISFVFWKC